MVVFHSEKDQKAKAQNMVIYDQWYHIFYNYPNI